MSDELKNEILYAMNDLTKTKIFNLISGAAIKTKD